MMLFFVLNFTLCTWRKEEDTQKEVRQKSRCIRFRFSCTDPAVLVS